MAGANLFQIFQKYPHNYLVETGSHTGNGIETALQAGFPNVVSLELADVYYEMCLHRFAGNSKVTLMKGDSAIILKDAIVQINEPITFWLDGHYSAGDTAKGLFFCPLIAELEQIKNHPIKTHTILIDDIRCWTPENPEVAFNTEALRMKLLEINPAYKLIMEDGYVPQDILVATV
jgi:hypothetical protein